MLVRYMSVTFISNYPFGIVLSQIISDNVYPVMNYLCTMVSRYLRHAPQSHLITKRITSIENSISFVDDLT